MKPKHVDTNAIFNVVLIPIYAGEHKKSEFLSQTGYACASITFQFGGHKDSWKKTERLSKLFSRLFQSPWFSYQIVLETETDNSRGEMSNTRL